MVDIYSACISVSQSVDAPRVTASLGLATDDRKSMIHLEWTLPTRINADGNAGEWLYAVLSRVVQDYDEHVVTSAEFENVKPEGENVNA